MATTKSELEQTQGVIAQHKVVAPEEWMKSRELMLVREKEVTRARDALAAERRRIAPEVSEVGRRFERDQTVIGQLVHPTSLTAGRYVGNLASMNSE